MKKVLFLNNFPSGKGTWLRSNYFARALSRGGYEVKLVCPSAHEGDWGVRRKTLSEHFTVITLPSPGRFGSMFGSMLRTIVLLWKVLMGRHEVVHAFGAAFPSIAVALLASRLLRRGVKVVVDWDEPRGDAYGEMYGPVRNITMKILERKIPAWVRPDAFTVVSRYFHIRLLQMGVSMEKIFLVPNGCDTELVKPMALHPMRRQLGWGHEEKLLLAMRDDNPDSIRSLMEVFTIVRTKKPKVKLIFLGGPYTKGKEWQSEALAGYASLSPYVEWVGEVPRSEISKYLAAADCLVLPQGGGVMDEARGQMRVGDYLSSGRPIASNAVGHARELLLSAAPNAVCDDPEDRDEFANLIIRLLEDQPYADAVGAAGLSLAKGRQGWHTIGGEVLAIYGTLTGND